MRDLERRMLDLLNLVVTKSRRRRGEVDQHGGYCRGTASQVLMGKIELKVRHVIDILEVCEADPKAFFRAVTADFEAPVDLPPLQTQIRAAARAHGLDPETAVAEADRRFGSGRDDLPIEDLVTLVRRHVALALEERQAQAPKKRRKPVKPARKAKKAPRKRPGAKRKAAE